MAIRRAGGRESLGRAKQPPVVRRGERIYEPVQCLGKALDIQHNRMVNQEEGQRRQDSRTAGQQDSRTAGQSGKEGLGVEGVEEK
eukprot:757946-Hanusia_phi.AAC.1